MSSYISLASLSERYASPAACIASSFIGNAYDAHVHAVWLSTVVPRLDLLNGLRHLADDLHCRILLRMPNVPECTTLVVVF